MTETLHDLPKPPAHSAGKKVGPLPVWAWGASIGGGILLVVLYRRHKAATAVPITAATDPTASDPTADAYPSGYDSTGGSGGGGTVGTTTSGSQTYATDSAWAIAASDFLISSGADPATVGTAIYNYINGLPLTPEQTALINRALAGKGTPPEGPLPIVPTDSTTGGTTTPVTDSGPAPSGWATGLPTAPVVDPPSVAPSAPLTGTTPVTTPPAKSKYKASIHTSGNQTFASLAQQYNVPYLEIAHTNPSVWAQVGQKTNKAIPNGEIINIPWVGYSD